MELHDRYGGSRQGGIAPCAKTPKVLIFTDGASGGQHGYSDEWKDDGCFHYTGEGQHGDQQMTKGNRAIAEHAGCGLTLRLFDGALGTVRCAGQMELADNPSW